MDVLPTDEQGRTLDLAPGDPLPAGAKPPVRVDLFPAAEWTTGVYCRCFPDRCPVRPSD